MATKTKAPPAIMALPVSFANVNIGDGTCRLGVSVDRKELGVGAADKQLCGKRLSGTILARSNGGPDQDSLPGINSDFELESVFDVKSVGFNKKRISFGLTFALASVDVEVLSHFAKRSGVFTITEAVPIPEDEPGDDDDDDDGDDEE